MKLYFVKQKGLFHRSFVLAISPLFYLPENEHAMRRAIEGSKLGAYFGHHAPCVLVVCSYNGMIDLSGDDLRSVAGNALINYLLLWREEMVWLGQDTFYAGGDDTPRRVRELFARTDGEGKAQGDE